MIELQGIVKEPKVFSIQVAGIKCTNCAGKITKGLTEGLTEKNAKVSVSIMQQKISLTIFEEQSIQEAIAVLKTIGFPAINQPVLLSGGPETHRTISFVLKKLPEAAGLQMQIGRMLGVVKEPIVVESEEGYHITVTYNGQILKGREIADIIASIDQNYQVINPRIQAFSTAKSRRVDKINVRFTIGLCLYFFILNMLLPFTGEWFDTVLTFPSFLGVYSFITILNSAVTFLVMKHYAQGFIQRAYLNYRNYKSTNMETLIALGSTSAFLLYLFFLAKYSLDMLNGQLLSPAMAVMDISDSLTSASIIVLVVTIGKHFEDKIKNKIDQMTDQIFPESTLFKKMTVNYAFIKNRQLKIDKQQIYDVSLIQKNDILLIEPGVVLLDCIIISGEVTAIQSANTGCDEPKVLKKGERLQSGSKVTQIEDLSLVLVQNVLENSILMEIGTQVRLAQNQEENVQTGIQAICKKISSYFVIGVIGLSIGTMIAWSILLFFDIVSIDTCKVCWVVERGIGVLVASCPCALGLAVPSVIAIVLNLATKSGVLIKNNSVFEKIKKCSKIVFDKTGTLFTRIGKIDGFQVFRSQYLTSKIWEIVAIIQKEIRHPLAEILYKEAFRRSEIVGTNYGFMILEKPKVGKDGIEATLIEKGTNTKMQILIGNRHILENNQIPVPQVERNSEAATELFVAVNSKVVMAILINTHSDLRPQAKDVVEKLQRQKMEVHVLSGDSTESVRKLGEYLGVPSDCLHAEHSAFMKMKWIKDNQQINQRVVVMIGDGLNDIPCLQQAGIGISINAKSELNINAADVVILSESLYKILAFVRFLKKGNVFIKMNLFWAFAYNIVMMPIVAGAFYGLGVVVSPVWSSIAMSLSSLMVVGFSHFLLLFHYDDSLKAFQVKHLKVTDMSQAYKQDFQPQTQKKSRPAEKYKDLIDQL